MMEEEEEEEEDDDTNNAAAAARETKKRVEKAMSKNKFGRVVEKVISNMSECYVKGCDRSGAFMYLGDKWTNIRPMFQDFIRREFGVKSKEISPHDAKICSTHLASIPCRCVVCGEGGYRNSDLKTYEIPLRVTNSQMSFFLKRGLPERCFPPSKIKTMESRNHHTLTPGECNLRYCGRCRSLSLREPAPTTALNDSLKNHEDLLSNNNNNHKKQTSQEKNSFKSKLITEKFLPEIIEQDKDDQDINIHMNNERKPRNSKPRIRNIRLGTWNIANLNPSSKPKEAERLVKQLIGLDFINFTEVLSEESIQQIVHSLNNLSGGGGSTNSYGYHYHPSLGRTRASLNLAFVYRRAAIIGSLFAPMGGTRFDQSPILVVPMTDPHNKRVFNLRLRRGYIVGAHLANTRRNCVFVGLHLKSLRGDTFSHYKRMSQAHIVRSALQPFVNSFDDIVIMGDLNSAETDMSIHHLGDRLGSQNYEENDSGDDDNNNNNNALLLAPSQQNKTQAESGITSKSSFNSAISVEEEYPVRAEDFVRPPYQEVPRQYEIIVPTSQRTFILQTLRSIDVRTPRITLANVHIDSSPTWRRPFGSKSQGNSINAQLDHILFRFLDQFSVNAANSMNKYSLSSKKRKSKKLQQKNENAEDEHRHRFVLETIAPHFPRSQDFTSERTIHFDDEISDHALLVADIHFHLRR